jgi:putative membrane protein
MKDIWAYGSLDPGVVFALLVFVLLYARGWWILARRTPKPSPALRQRIGWFAAGILTLVVALLSPLAGMAEELLSVHMLQHNLLMLVAAPLLVLSYPLPAVLLGLPKSWRHALGRGWRQAGWLRRVWVWISLPLVAWLLQAGLLWAWHTPVLYQAAVENILFHALEHLSLLGSALLFWWVALDLFGHHQVQRGVLILFLLTAILPGGLLGALLSFSSTVWYPIYSERAAGWGWSALADQQLSGTMMWLPSGLVYLLAVLLMLKSWGAEKKLEWSRGKKEA